MSHIVILKLNNFVSIFWTLWGNLENFLKKTALTILTKCHLHQILDETNVWGCQNGFNICKFTKDIVVVKRPWKVKWLFWLISYND